MSLAGCYGVPHYRAKLSPYFGALEAVPVDQRRMAVRIDRPIVIPGIARVVMLGTFHLQAGNLFGSFRGIRFDDRFAENRIHVGHKEFWHDELGKE
jgi:hypothetical protein